MLDILYVALTTSCIVLSAARQTPTHGMVVNPQAADTLTKAYEMLSLAQLIVSLLQYLAG